MPWWSNKSKPGKTETPKTEETENPLLKLKYKYRDLRVHGSDEWMANAARKYRRMYDRYETTYIYAELSLYNKLFDERDWEVSIRFKCFFLNGSQKNELCSFEQEKTVSKDENIIYAGQGWGNATPGVYWLKGDYLWEAYVDEVKVGEAKFYVEDLGKAREGENLFFDLESVLLFEGDGRANDLPQKKYLVAFSQKDTRYVWVEFKFKNKTNREYYAEIFFNFYNDAGQLKGSDAYLTYIAANTQDKIYTLYPGWGGETPGRWGFDQYYLQIVFLETVLATVHFSVGDESKEGTPLLATAQSHFSVSAGANGASETTPEQILSASLNELNALTGLEKIKTEVNEMVQLVRFYQETGKDVLSKFSLHTVFTGNPGTGKTTVARLLSRIYKGLGILEKGHLVEVDREALVAGYIGQTAIKTAEKVSEAMGGILFIDEAYSLAQGRGSAHDFGGEAIQILLKRMEDHRGKFGIIVAGYTDQTQEFITSNPGLKSRFDKYFECEDYSPEEMYAIAERIFRKEQVKPDEAAATHLQRYFHFLHNQRDKHFGNARTVRQVVEESIRNQHLRLAAMKKEERTPALMETVLLADVSEFEIKDVTANTYRIGFKPGARL